jgi:hypothetical protein
MSIDQTNNVPQTSAEVDTLLNQINQPQPEMDATPVEPVPANTQQEPTEQPNIDDPTYDIVWKGENRTLPLSKIKSLAQQSFDYNEKMREFNIERRSFETEKNQTIETQKSLEYLQQVDTWAKENPELWQQAQNAFEANKQGQQVDNNQMNNPVLAKLQQQVELLQSTITKQQEETKIRQEEQSDFELNKVTQEYQDKNPHLDWVGKNELGLSLRDRIDQHAIDQGINNFRAAANDYLFEDHIKNAEMKAKEDAGTKIKQASKLGLGPVTPVPIGTLTKRAVKDVYNSSYEDLGNEALRELGIIN